MQRAARRTSSQNDRSKVNGDAIAVTRACPLPSSALAGACLSYVKTHCKCVHEIRRALREVDCARCSARCLRPFPHGAVAVHPLLFARTQVTAVDRKLLEATKGKDSKDDKKRAAAKAAAKEEADMLRLIWGDNEVPPPPTPPEPAAAASGVVNGRQGAKPSRSAASAGAPRGGGAATANQGLHATPAAPAPIAVSRHPVTTPFGSGATRLGLDDAPAASLGAEAHRTAGSPRGAVIDDRSGGPSLQRSEAAHLIRGVYEAVYGTRLAVALHDLPHAADVCAKLRAEVGLDERGGADESYDALLATAREMSGVVGV